MVVQATLMLFGSFFVMLFAGVPIPAAIPSPFWLCRSFHWAATL